jgi:hypothetical protein
MFFVLFLFLNHVCGRFTKGLISLRLFLCVNEIYYVVALFGFGVADVFVELPMLFIFSQFVPPWK